MSKKISIGVVIGLMFIVILLTSSITISVIKDQYNDLLLGLPEKIEKYDVLDELDTIISQNYYSEDDVEDIIISAMAQGYLEGLSDEDCDYFSADEYADYLSETQGEMNGIGVQIAKTDDGYMKVIVVEDGSPALEVGLEVGDVIVAFDGDEVTSINYEEMEERLSGDKLTSVNLTYVRDEVSTTIDVSQGYDVPSVDTYIYDEIGYIKISAFYKTTASEVQEAVDMFTSSGIQALVIDVRGNTSENYDYAIEVLDIFAPMSESSSPVMQVVGEGDEVLKTYETTSGEVNLQTIVMINSITKGAAEIFACNMRDFSKAELLGTTTAGDGLMQEIFELSSGAAVLLTTGKIIPYKSDNFESIGVAPDYKVYLTSGTNVIYEDTQFLEAVAILTAE